MTKAQLIEQIFQKKSYLCVGLDPDFDKIPEHLKSTEQPLFEFCKQIVDATKDYCVAYKPNTAFFECYGDKGWLQLQKTIKYIGESHLTIADAKRGDIGNTSNKYAQAFFEHLNADAITIQPYMGKDSVDAFLAYKNKWVVLLAATSNKSAEDFQFLNVNASDEKLYQTLIKKSAGWATSNQLMYVTGATRPELLKEIREQVPDYFLLVPGVGAQGGSLQEVSEAALTKECGLLINVSRGILYKSNGEDFASAAAQEAKRIQMEMAELLAGA
ncbi:MAG: orotidine-5'-phosphate decarboxylase [Bacteroidia bacterium]|nr:orotidine-5'-phosphate decarboxylase [Bacteroidia bacterium]NNM15921.1 orotidine-5'-phosphate decarboxylase [Bacteroidia bacterium]